MVMENLVESARADLHGLYHRLALTIAAMSVATSIREYRRLEGRIEPLACRMAEALADMTGEPEPTIRRRKWGRTLVDDDMDAFEADRPRSKAMARNLEGYTLPVSYSTSGQRIDNREE